MSTDSPTAASSVRPTPSPYGLPVTGRANLTAEERRVGVSIAGEVWFTEEQVERIVAAHRDAALAEACRRIDRYGSTVGGCLNILRDYRAEVSS